MRKNRKYSEHGFYHVVIRGVNKQNIFYDDSDRRYFISLLKVYSKKNRLEIHAFCLMENHVHLLIEDHRKTISKFMQIVASVYARHFNKKYDRIGHLYQDRFASETIEDREYFLTVFRYILQNPEKAGIDSTEKYNWSSYKLIKIRNTITTNSMILSYLGNVESIESFLKQKTENECLDISLRPSEKEAYYIEKIKKLLKSNTPIIKPDLQISEIMHKLHLLKKAKISIRTISRITGIMAWMVQKA